MSNHLTIKTLKNAYGIKSLNINNKVDNHANTLKNNIIYASNGIFKTSFSNFFQALKLGKEPLDRITNDKVTYSIFVGENNINDIDLSQNLIVFNNDIFNPQTINELNPQIARLAIANDMAEEITNIYIKLDDIKERLSNIFNYIGLNDTYFNIFTNLNEYNRLDYLEEIVCEILKEEPLEFKLEIPLEIFLSEEYAKVDNEQTRETINEIKKYITNKNKESPFDNKFNVFNYDSLLTGVRTTDFLNDNEKRKICFDGVTYKKYDEFVNALETSAKELLGDVNKKKLDNILKQIGNRKNIEKKFRSEIFENIEIINTLQYSRKQIIANKIIKEYFEELTKLSTMIENLRLEIASFAEKTKEKSSVFVRALKTFDHRFDPVFKIKIVNQQNAALGIQLPVFSIKHNSQNLSISEERLNEVISSGERTSYNILKFIVQYETIKNNKPIIILDDVIDSFDSGNRYAFIEYIEDIIEDGANTIVLTNNFNFYKNLKKHIPSMNALFASKNQMKTINIEENNEIMLHDKTKIFNIQTEKDLISAIPFAREISSYTDNKNNKNFLNFLHIKTETNLLTLGDLVNNIKTTIKLETASNINLQKAYLEAIFSQCDEIADSKVKSTETLKEKLVLAMGLRLKVELIIIDGETKKRTANIKKNQTRQLFSKYKSYLFADFVKNVETILVVTPEFIHVNAFMYEPLIDVPIKKLTNLYKKIINFENNKNLVWKNNYYK